MADFTPYSAAHSKVRITGVAFVAKKWVFTPKAEALDVTSFEGNRFGQYIPGIKDGDLSIDDADIDGANNPYDSPPNLQAGETLTDVRLYLNADGNDVSGPCWIIDECLITEAPNTQEVRQTGKISIKGKASGEFHYPTGDIV